ncbi:MAG: hypothetical protein NC247_06290 [Ruminococcus flavefaciens]|nr:hypothetical protein [Ruminococcus flavefaciens]MCM1380762.1 hypothetical protein [Muribaculaceae bacterium]MCM1479390.1 hypothetical protein [Muribaculaceae bacterium]
MLHFRKKVEFLGAWYASCIKVWLGLLYFFRFGKSLWIRTNFGDFTALAYPTRFEYLALAVDFSSASAAMGQVLVSVEKGKIDSTHSPPQIHFERLSREQTQWHIWWQE